MKRETVGDIMTPEEFFEYIGEARFYRCQGKRRLNLIREQYTAYVAAYRVSSFYEAYALSIGEGNSHSAIMRGLKDRDAGKPMVSVPGLL